MIDTFLSRLPLPRAEDGFTLIELLIGVALALVLFGATLGMLESSQRIQARDTDWALAIQEGRTGLARMAEEIRQAYTIANDTHNSIEFYATIGGRKEEIYYNCAEKEPETTVLYRCVRKAGEFTGYEPPGNLLTGAASVPVIRHVLNGSPAHESEAVFQEFSPNAIAPDLVTIRLELPANNTAGTKEGHTEISSSQAYRHHVVLENAAYIRNANLG